MKLAYINNIVTDTYAESRNACVGFCQNVRASVQKAKNAILAEFEETLTSRPHLLRLALNEAEALAWQNPYPHLVFPTLAQEKAMEMAEWHARQESLRLTGSILAPAT